MGCLRAMSLCPRGIAVIGLDWLFTGARGCCRCCPILAGGGAAVGIAEYGTYLLAAASVEMQGIASSLSDGDTGTAGAIRANPGGILLISIIFSHGHMVL